MVNFKVWNYRRKRNKNRFGKPVDYIECMDYFSWERFFTACLSNETKGTYLAYAKKTLNPAYLTKNVETAILSQMDKINLHWKTENLE